MLKAEVMSACLSRRLFFEAEWQVVKVGEIFELQHQLVMEFDSLRPPNVVCLLISYRVQCLVQKIFESTKII